MTLFSEPNDTTTVSASSGGMSIEVILEPFVDQIAFDGDQLSIVCRVLSTSGHVVKVDSITWLINGSLLLAQPPSPSPFVTKNDRVTITTKLVAIEDDSANTGIDSILLFVSLIS